MVAHLNYTDTHGPIAVGAHINLAWIRRGPFGIPAHGPLQPCTGTVDIAGFWRKVRHIKVKSYHDDENTLKLISSVVISKKTGEMITIEYGIAKISAFVKTCLLGLYIVSQVFTLHTS